MYKTWRVIFCPEFEIEFQGLETGIQDELLAHLLTLKEFGPQLGRPLVDTLKGSRFTNMKELRFSHRGAAYRFAFAFDPVRRAVVLVGANKRAKKQKAFYEELIRMADSRFAAHLDGLN